jgi:hypothetical protein
MAYSAVNEPYRGNPWLIRLPVLFILGGALFVGVLSAFVTGVQTMYADRIFPGVWSNGVNIGGLTRKSLLVRLIRTLPMTTRLCSPFAITISSGSTPPLSWV